MHKNTWLQTGFTFVVIGQFLLSLIFPAGALAASLQPGQAAVAAQQELVSVAAQSAAAAPLAPAAPSLQVNILGSPQVLIDSNNQNDPSRPRVFVLEAQVTNTGTTEATNVTVAINYDNPGAGWVLLEGESPTRAAKTLAPGASFYAYWFATYPLGTIGNSYNYSVSASASNAPTPVTSNASVTTVSATSAANSGITLVAVNVVVGVEFTIDIDYNLSNNAKTAHFSPVGNADFNPAAYRLLSSTLYYYDINQVLLRTDQDRVYTASVPATATHAKATYKFIAQQAVNTRLCSYAMIKFNTQTKYDNGYCNPTQGGVIDIQGTLSLALKKVASKALVEQKDTIDYTIYYTNTGTAALQYVWIWDEYNPAVVTDTHSYTPLNPIISSGLVAWNIGTLPVGAKGNTSFSVRVDSNEDITNNTQIVNNGYFSVTTDSLPTSPALTSTVITTVQAPIVGISKTDGLTSITAGASSVYTIDVTNTGPVAAPVVTLVDTLPGPLSLNGSPTPAPNNINGQTLTWNLGPLAAGQTKTVTVPVTVAITTPTGTVLSNTATATYQNAAGHTFTQKSATDTTAVDNAVLSISKSDSTDPVLTTNQLVYTLSYENTGPAAATNVFIRDTLPTGTTFASCSNGCTLVGGQYTWDIGTVAAGSSGFVTLTVDVNDDLQTGDKLRNNTYSISSSQTGTIAGTPIETTVSRNAAYFIGKTFIDANGNGILDGGEAGLASVPMTLTQATVPNQNSSGNGSFSFRVETPGLIDLTASPMAGYFNTTPLSLNTIATLGITTTVNFGYAPDGSSFSAVFGRVYADANHNGALDGSELGIAGVTVSSADANPTSATTNQFGWYNLLFTSTDPTTIVETNPSGYVSTTPDSIPAIPVLSSNSDSPYDFGDFAGISISGQVYDDLNVNGAQDPLEDGLAGATVSAGADSVLTDGTGEYTLYVPIPPVAPVTIEVALPVEYTATDVTPGTGMTRFNATTLRIASPVAGTVYSDGLFGAALQSGVVTISGFVWNDNGASSGGIRANGLRESNEPGIPGSLVSLSSGLSALTATDGSFSIFAPSGEAITITQTNLNGYISTNAIPGDLNTSKVDNDTLLVSALNPGDISSGHLFGDVQPTSLAVIPGFVFDDANSNGVKDGGEAGLGGVTVTLEFQDGHTIDIPTNPDGSYTFFVEPGTDLILRTAGPGGAYHPTTPIDFHINAATAMTYPDTNFGFSTDTGVAVITGIVFDDLNSNGDMDFGERGLAGAKVSLNGAGTITTVDNGLIAGVYQFDIPLAEPGLLLVSEVNPAGYRSTTPDEVIISATPGSAYYLDFGDTNNPAFASIFGTVFDDFDQDGLRDPGEPGLDGVQVSVTTSGDPITTTTKSFGQFSYGFNVQEAGFHRVTSADPALSGYHSTTPDEVNILVKLGNSYSVDFGDSRDTNAMILGTVFNDANGDGDQDAVELGLSGVTVALFNGPTVTTNAFGWYSFPILSDGLQVVSETNPPGYYSTTPDQVSVDVSGANNYTVNFGDLNDPFATVLYGTVFNDLNVDGVRDANELGIPGVTITLTNSILFVYQTNAWGSYSFLIDAPGTYTVEQVDLPDYVSTDAIPGSAAVSKVDANTLSAEITAFGIDLGENLFGDALANQVTTISGFVFNDNGADNGVIGDGLRNGKEPGLAGATVALSSGLSQVTGSDGAFSIFAPANSTVTVDETNPNGYLSTGAVPGDNASRVTDDRLSVDTGIGGSASSGNLFADVLPSEVAVFAGTVFDDLNENGAQDPGEPGLANINVSLTVEGGATILVKTDSNGNYLLAMAANTNAIIASAGPGGLFYPTTPESIVVSPAAPGLYEGNDFGYSNDTDSAVLLGTVFDDLNGNGVQEQGEGGLGGVLISLSDGRSTNTLADGRYSFPITDTLPVEITVTETDPDGYRSTTPNVVFAGITAYGAEYIVDFGDTSRTDVASISGMVFNDLNINGAFDPGEPPIAGVTVSLDDGVATQTYQTNQWGLYTFQVDATGTYTLTETDLGAYVSTNAIPGSPSVTKVDNSTLTVDVTALNVTLGDNLFADALANEVTTISGKVFDDLNANGSIDPGEPGLAGATLSLNTGLSMVTASDGLFSLFAPVGTVVELTEDNPFDYISTNVLPGNNAVKLDADRLRITTQVGGSSSTNNRFLDVFSPNVAIISGLVFEDLDGDKFFDTGETGIGGVTITLGGAASRTTTTASDGTYQFIVDTAGAYSVVETDLPGYFSTTPNEAHLDVSIGNDYKVDFGDAPEANPTFATILGTVFDDLNANGAWDLSEPGIAGVTVKLDGNAATTLTDAFGRYGFVVNATGLHVVAETNKAGYLSTTPDLLVVDVANLGADYTANFGDTLASQADFATIFGTVFDDLDADGMHDGNEPGIAGVTVTLDVSTTATTDLLGAYTFKVDTAGMHTVVESDDAAYFSTTPNEVHVNVALGNGYAVNFGDALKTSGFGAIYGTVYNDLNLDALRSGNELGLVGVTLTLGSTTVQTNAYGSYTFKVAAGAHTVVETDPANFQSSTPNQVTKIVANGSSEEANFGDYFCSTGADQYEQDDSASAAKAILFGAGNTQLRNFFDDTTDWIKFTTLARATYTITTEAWGERSDTILALYASDMLTVLAVNDDIKDTTDFSSQLVWEAPSAGTYYLKVTNRTGLYGCRTGYDIMVDEVPSPIKYLYLPLITRDASFSAPVAPVAEPPAPVALVAPAESLENLRPVTPLGVIQHICKDAFEIDDTWESATEILGGASQLRSFDSNPAVYAADKDHVWFTANLFDRVVFTSDPLVNTHATLELYDEQRNLLASGTDMLDWQAEQDGKYYLIISPTTDAFGCADVAGYTLNMNVTLARKLFLPLINR